MLKSVHGHKLDKSTNAEIQAFLALLMVLLLSK